MKAFTLNFKRIFVYLFQIDKRLSASLPDIYGTKSTLVVVMLSK